MPTSEYVLTTAEPKVKSAAAAERASRWEKTAEQARWVRLWERDRAAVAADEKARRGETVSYESAKADMKPTSGGKRRKTRRKSKTHKRKSSKKMRRSRKSRRRR